MLLIKRVIFVFAVRIVYDKDSGRARGFGFVIFSNEDAAKSAKDAMDGKVGH
jgi:RNA recognition motif-containing protein